LTVPLRNLSSHKPAKVDSALSSLIQRCFRWLCAVFADSALSLLIQCCLRWLSAVFVTHRCLRWFSAVFADSALSSLTQRCHWHSRVLTQQCMVFSEICINKYLGAFKDICETILASESVA
jgi:hypothetical protein